MTVLKRVRPEYKNDLQNLARISYSSNFGSHWNGPGLEIYLEDQFGDERMINDLRDSNIDYYFIMHQSERIGFAKINRKASHEDFPKYKCAELEKIYLLSDYKRMGIGKKAMKEIVENLKTFPLEILFLCVIESNDKALSFYEAIGFEFLKKCRLEIPHFKDELRGMDQLFLRL